MTPGGGDDALRAPARALKFGSVPYLNARPLLEGLGAAGPVRLEVPSRLVPLLTAGEVDVALAPVVAAFDAPGLTLVPEAAIASRGAVESVLLFCRETPQAARTVALDASSRTSADLVRVLYQGLWRGSPRFFHRPSDPDLGAVESDAVLLIGDPALCARWSGPPPVDLGEAWTRWTGLPFVFAVWLARSPEAAAAAAPVLRRAAAAGRARIDAIAAEAASSMGLPEPRLRRYLRESIRYDLGPGERAGMERFRELRSALPAPHFS